MRGERIQIPQYVAFRWRADDGPIGSLVFFLGIRPSIAIKLYFVIFQGGGSGSPVPPLWIRPCVHTPPNSDLGHCFHVLQTGLMCHVMFLCQGHHVRPKILKQHVAGIEVSGLFDLKKDHAVFAFDVS